MTAWFVGLSTTGKGLSVIGAVAAITLAFAAAFGDHIGLPAQVEVNTQAITRDSLEIRGVSQKMDRMICLQLLPDGDDPLRCP